MENDLSRFDLLLKNAAKRKQPRRNVKQALKEFEAYKAEKQPAEKAKPKQPKEKDFFNE